MRKGDKRVVGLMRATLRRAVTTVREYIHHWREPSSRRADSTAAKSDDFVRGRACQPFGKPNFGAGLPAGSFRHWLYEGAGSAAAARSVPDDAARAPTKTSVAIRMETNVSEPRAAHEARIAPRHGGRVHRRHRAQTLVAESSDAPRDCSNRGRRRTDEEVVLAAPPNAGAAVALAVGRARAPLTLIRLR
jgi:hypothetical protein